MYVCLCISEIAQSKKPTLLSNLPLQFFIRKNNNKIKYLTLFYFMIRIEESK